ncbi:MAG: glycosyltransferase family 2 protein [Sedimenticola sp.]
MKDEIPGKENICAVIVTYHPDPDFPEHLARIVKQVGQVVVVDNYSDSASVAMLQDVCVRLKSKLILNDYNMGLATALNQGVNLAHDMNFTWTLLFDQDTAPTDAMVKVFAAVYKQFPDKGRLALIGANYSALRSGRIRNRIESDHVSGWVEKKTIITSGSLLRLSLFKVIGPFRSEFFIDHIDHEYCLRARSEGFRVIMTQEPTMAHSIGAPSTHQLLWKSIRTTNHSALRQYYMMRNHIVLSREYAFKEPGWVITTLYSSMKSIFLMILFEKEKLVKMKFIILGIMDGLTSNFNRMNLANSGKLFAD